MKIRKRDYLYTLIDIFISRPARNGIKKVRYNIELGGKDGYEINGIDDYWGRYGSIDKIIELAHSLSGPKQDFEFYYPAKEYNRIYSHRIGIIGCEEKGIIGVEYTEASSQCGSYNKFIKLTDLKNEILMLDEIALTPEKHGYEYTEY